MLDMIVQGLTLPAVQRGIVLVQRDDSIYYGIAAVEQCSIPKMDMGMQTLALGGVLLLYAAVYTRMQHKRYWKRRD